MQLKTAICSLLLILSACTQPTRTTAIKQFSRDEQVQIATERNIIADSTGEPLFDEKGHRVQFTMTPAVFDDWERMRLDLRN
jgi:hypothetical protein